MKKLFILFALLLIPAFAHGADVTGPFEYKLQCVSHVSSTVTGTTAETTLASCTIPGGAIGANGTIAVMVLTSHTNNANAKTLRVKFGSAAFYAGSVASVASTHQYITASNRNSEASQLAYASISTSFGGTSGALVFTAVNTAQPQTFSITCQLGTASDFCELASFDVWIMRQ